MPEALDGLLACGRHISCDKNSHGFMREIPQCWITGQAAGVAAAVAVAHGVAPRAVDIAALQAALLSQGVYLRQAREPRAGDASDNATHRRRTRHARRPRRRGRATRDGPAACATASALGAERLVDTNNVCATVSATTPFMRDFARRKGGMDAVFSEFSLDSDEVVKIPKVTRLHHPPAARLRPDEPERMGVDEATVQFYRQGEAFITGLGVQATNTCTPYQVGNVPTRGEHCAWMESSAVIYCNSVLGARTNTEGRESVGAAMLTGRIPYWGYHLDANRRGTHHVRARDRRSRPPPTGACSATGSATRCRSACRWSRA